MRKVSMFLSRRMFMSIVLALGLWSVPVIALVEDQHTTMRFSEGLDFVLPVSQGCSEEEVHVYGELEGMTQTTIFPNGDSRVVTHFSPHVNAVGLVSGLEYQIVGPAQIITTNQTTGQSVAILVDIIRLISPGSTANLVITHTMHITVNADGETTVEFDRFQAACRG